MKFIDECRRRPSFRSFSLVRLRRASSEAFSPPADKKYGADEYEKMKPLKDNPLPHIYY
jgi:hypothetical protein